jgi:hypothetical protein
MRLQVRHASQFIKLLHIAKSACHLRSDSTLNALEIDGSYISFIPWSMPQIKVLYVQRCTKVLDFGPRFENLRQLNLESLPGNQLRCLSSLRHLTSLFIWSLKLTSVWDIYFIPQEKLIALSIHTRVPLSLFAQLENVIMKRWLPRCTQLKALECTFKILDNADFRPTTSFAGLLEYPGLFKKGFNGALPRSCMQIVDITLQELVCEDMPLGRTTQQCFFLIVMHSVFIIRKNNFVLVIIVNLIRADFRCSRKQQTIRQRSKLLCLHIECSNHERVPFLHHFHIDVQLTETH